MKIHIHTYLKVNILPIIELCGKLIPVKCIKILSIKLYVYIFFSSSGTTKANTMKRNGVRLQVEGRKNGNGVKGDKGEDNDDDEEKQEDNFYMRVYDDAVAKKTPIDNTIIEYVKLIIISHNNFSVINILYTSYSPFNT